MRTNKMAVVGEGLQELEGVPHRLGTTDLGIAAVGGAIGGGRKVAAGCP